MQLRLYGREYCGLCLQMKAQLEAIASGRFYLQWIDIEDVEDLELRYGELVPVLTDAEDHQICHYHLDLAALDARLRKLS